MSIQDTIHGGQPKILSQNYEFMTEENKDRLRTNIVPLLQNMTVESVVNVLYGRRVFTFNEKQLIYRNGATDSEKVERFIDLILKKPDSAYYDFLEALVETEQEHVANILKGEGIR